MVDAGCASTCRVGFASVQEVCGESGVTGRVACMVWWCCACAHCGMQCTYPAPACQEVALQYSQRQCGGGDVAVGVQCASRGWGESACGGGAPVPASRHTHSSSALTAHPRAQHPPSSRPPPSHPCTCQKDLAQQPARSEGASICFLVLRCTEHGPAPPPSWTPEMDCGGLVEGRGGSRSRGRHRSRHWAPLAAVTGLQPSKCTRGTIWYDFTRTHTHTHTRTRTHMHVHARTRAHICIHTCTHIHTQMHTHTCTHMCAHTAHTHTHAHTHARTPPPTPPPIPTPPHTHTHVRACF
jgi:hypothetical protein